MQRKSGAMTNRAILKLNSNELHFVRHNIGLEITQQVAPSKSAEPTSHNLNIHQNCGFALQSRVQHPHTQLNHSLNKVKRNC